MKIIIYEVTYQSENGWARYHTTDPVAYHKKAEEIIEKYPLSYSLAIYTEEAIAGEF